MNDREAAEALKALDALTEAGLPVVSIHLTEKDETDVLTVRFANGENAVYTRPREGLK